MNFLELREKYPEFSYNWYKIEENENEYKITYEFEIKGLSKFNPTWINLKTIFLTKNY